MTTKPTPAEATVHVPEIYAAIDKVRSDMGAVSKDKRNPQQGFMYRGHDDICNAAHQPMIRAGVICHLVAVDNLDIREKKFSNSTGVHVFITCRYRLIAISDGSFIESVVIGEAMDAGDKAVAKALTMAQKSFLVQNLLLPTEDTEDADAHSPVPDTVAIDPDILKMIEAATSVPQLVAILNALPSEASRIAHMPYFSERRAQIAPKKNGQPK